VLVSAGGTREPIDPVRFIGNRSSGRMGLALAERAAARGAEVTLVAANVALAAAPGIRRVDVETAAELSSALEAEFGSTDVLLMAAAPADFRPVASADRKIAREGSIELDLEPTEDILAGLGKGRRPEQTIIGFAAETPADSDSSAASATSRPGPAPGLERARQKLARKGADAIVLNDVSRPEIGFESSQNEVVIVEADREIHVPLAAKESVADAILDRVEALRAHSASQSASDQP
jgi:phosphopantothenoylcysteine decarboxylase/phosphopantothenate--cysteine ligase